MPVTEDGLAQYSTFALFDVDVRNVENKLIFFVLFDAVAQVTALSDTMCGLV